ncbi:hypothetical protein B0H11DRAFT_1998972 [Mycena galericulata]|nr:hypothetical protein B0H11DRAFT_2110691 [Mycena galericulata]KAJ7448885.1 hypothetical protein B0H11DRAFT_2079857 [Mycena galericulata]KAJ7498171.1 hypothetical protein B0H11DRAFT_1998972 [Mycena galericulata]
MTKRAAATSEKAVNAAAIAAAEAKEAAEKTEKPAKKGRGRPKKVQPAPAAETVRAEEEEKADAVASTQEEDSIVIEWDFDLTWTLISAIEGDEDISGGLFPGVGAIKRSGGKPKTYFYHLLAETLFKEHAIYADAFAKAVKPKQLEAWMTKIKNRIKTLVDRAREHIIEMGETGAGMTSKDDITPGSALMTKWDVIKKDSPWFFHVRALIASRPNLRPVGLGNNDTDIDTSILLRTYDDDTSSTFEDIRDLDDQLSQAPDPSEELSQGPDPPEGPLDVNSEGPIDVNSDSDSDDMPEVPTLAGAKKRKAGSTKASRKETKTPAKKMKPAPATSIPAAPAAVPSKKSSAKDRFSATVVAEEETHQQMLGLKKEKNDARKEVALRKIEMEGQVRLAKERSKQAEKERKLDLARLKMEQEHQFRMAQLQAHAGPTSMSFSGVGASGGGGASQHDNPFSGLYDDLPRLPPMEDAAPSSYRDQGF